MRDKSFIKVLLKIFQDFNIYCIKSSQYREILYKDEKNCKSVRRDKNESTKKRKSTQNANYKGRDLKSYNNKPSLILS